MIVRFVVGDPGPRRLGRRFAMPDSRGRGRRWEMSVGPGRVPEMVRGAADRVLHRVGGVLVWAGSDAAVRHEVRVRRRCGVWRYEALMGPALVMPRARQRVFQWRLRRSARRASVADLQELLDYGWRERLVAGWLIAAGRRADLRPRLARDLRDPSPNAYLYPYCVALACLGGDQDAQILRDYLVMSLALPGENERHCQADAMAALLYLDRRLGSDYAGPLLTDDGAWARWPGSIGVDLDAQIRDTASLVAFANGADPGLRTRVRWERTARGGHGLDGPDRRRDHRR